MKTLKLSLLAFMALSLTVSAKAQTADDVINKYFDAIGGRELLSKVKTMYMENNLEAMGNSMKLTANCIYGKGIKSETEFNGQKIVQCITDNGGWMINPMAGVTTAQPMPKDLYNERKENLILEAPLINYAENGGKVELVGKETLDSASVYKIKLTDKDGGESYFYFDATTYYKVKATKTDEQSQTDIITAFSDYQKTNIGYLMPFTTKVSMSNGMEMTMTIKKVVINSEIDPKIFDQPQ